MELSKEDELKLAIEKAKDAAKALREKRDCGFYIITKEDKEHMQKFIAELYKKDKNGIRN